MSARWMPSFTARFGPPLAFSRVISPWTDLSETKPDPPFTMPPGRLDRDVAATPSMVIGVGAD